MNESGSVKSGGGAPDQVRAVCVPPEAAAAPDLSFLEAGRSYPAEAMVSAEAGEGIFIEGRTIAVKLPAGTAAGDKVLVLVRSTEAGPALEIRPRDVAEQPEKAQAHGAQAALKQILKDLRITEQDLAQLERALRSSSSESPAAPLPPERAETLLRSGIILSEEALADPAKLLQRMSSAPEVSSAEPSAASAVELGGKERELLEALAKEIEQALAGESPAARLSAVLEGESAGPLFKPKLVELVRRQLAAIGRMEQSLRAVLSGADGSAVALLAETLRRVEIPDAAPAAGAEAELRRFAGRLREELAQTTAKTAEERPAAVRQILSRAVEEMAREFPEDENAKRLSVQSRHLLRSIAAQTQAFLSAPSEGERARFAEWTVSLEQGLLQSPGRETEPHALVPASPKEANPGDRFKASAAAEKTLAVKEDFSSSVQNPSGAPRPTAAMDVRAADELAAPFKALAERSPHGTGFAREFQLFIRHQLEAMARLEASLRRVLEDADPSPAAAVPVPSRPGRSEAAVHLAEKEAPPTELFPAEAGQEHSHVPRLEELIASLKSISERIGKDGGFYSARFRRMVEHQLEVISRLESYLERMPAEPEARPSAAGTAPVTLRAVSKNEPVLHGFREAQASQREQPEPALAAEPLVAWLRTLGSPAGGEAQAFRGRFADFVKTQLELLGYLEASLERTLRVSAKESGVPLLVETLRSVDLKISPQSGETERRFKEFVARLREELERIPAQRLARSDTEVRLRLEEARETIYREFGRREETAPGVNVLKPRADFPGRYTAALKSIEAQIATILEAPEHEFEPAVTRLKMTLAEAKKMLPAADPLGRRLLEFAGELSQELSAKSEAPAAEVKEVLKKAAATIEALKREPPEPKELLRIVEGKVKAAVELPERELKREVKELQVLLSKAEPPELKVREFVRRLSQELSAKSEAPAAEIREVLKRAAASLEVLAREAPASADLLRTLGAKLAAAQTSGDAQLRFEVKELQSYLAAVQTTLPETFAYGDGFGGGFEAHWRLGGVWPQTAPQPAADTAKASLAQRAFDESVHDMVAKIQRLIEDVLRTMPDPAPAVKEPAPLFDAHAGEAVCDLLKTLGVPSSDMALAFERFAPALRSLDLRPVTMLLNQAAALEGSQSWKSFSPVLQGMVVTAREAGLTSAEPVEIADKARWLQTVLHGLPAEVRAGVLPGVRAAEGAADPSQPTRMLEDLAEALAAVLWEGMVNADGAAAEQSDLRRLLPGLPLKPAALSALLRPGPIKELPGEPPHLPGPAQEVLRVLRQLARSFELPLETTGERGEPAAEFAGRMAEGLERAAARPEPAQREFLKKALDNIREKIAPGKTDPERLKTAEEILKTIQSVENTIKGQEVLSKLRPLVQAAGEPVMLLFPTLIQNYLSTLEVVFYPQRVNEEGHEEQQRRRRGGRDGFQQVQFHLNLPLLGRVEVSLAHSRREALVNLTFEREDVSRFVSKRLDKLKDSLEEAGMEQVGFKVAVARPRPITPAWVGEVTGRGGIVA